MAGAFAKITYHPSSPLKALKALTRTNAHITRESIAEFIESLDVAESVKQELRAITPQSYTGVFE